MIIESVKTRVCLLGFKSKRERMSRVRVGREAGEDEAVAIVDVEKDAASLPRDPRVGLRRHSSLISSEINK